MRVRLLVEFVNRKVESPNGTVSAAGRLLGMLFTREALAAGRGTVSESARSPEIETYLPDIFLLTNTPVNAMLNMFLIVGRGTGVQVCLSVEFVNG